jgi:hypothetical protein
MSTDPAFNCTWDDYGTPKNIDLLWMVVQQSGCGVRCAISEDMWAKIAKAIEENKTFQIHMQANQRRKGVIFVAVPTRGGLHVEIDAIPRVKATGLQMVDGADARSRPRPENRHAAHK